MNNKIVLQLFSVIAVSALAFFGLANAGAFAVDKLLFPEREFGSNTRIGSVDVSNVSEREAKIALTQQLAGWQSGTTLQVVYMDAVADYPMDAAELLLEESVATAETGERNKLDVSLSEEATAVFLSQNFPTVTFSAEDITNINSMLADALGSGNRRVSISTDAADFIKGITAETIFPAMSPEAALVAQVLDGIELAPGETFSLLESIEAGNLDSISDAALTEVASALYNLVLQTSFTVEQRSIGTKIPETVPLGFEAAIDQDLGIDFAFTNTTDSSFILNADQSAESLYVALTGYPFVYTYDVYAQAPEIVEPRTIKEYSALVTSGKQVKEEGEDGLRTTVNRLAIDNEDNVLETTVVSTDFYPPTHKVEVYPLEAAESTGTDGTASDGTTDGTSTDGTPTDGTSSDGTTDGTTTDGTTTDGTSTTGGGTTTDGTATDKGGEDSETDSTDSDQGDSADDSTDSENESYDKGGNLIGSGK
ncbi:VanW family protein [Planococcus lenghuensis]|uniref:G5 domain-containing protein n=1 Tax=Planococcus lenghuensis TaxID=2213202 RepID=A0A1Q2KXE7_9BACL|nr:VanW family protein [Planococcus lenghuensis]AQQ52888.1 hypothetical protein B0X71_07155 [Planococcus lenghuensis]